MAKQEACDSPIKTTKKKAASKPLKAKANVGVAE
jgi:hypothetical protein